MSRTDRLIGIGLGLIIGLVALIIVIFGGGAGQQIDAPSLHQSTAAEQPATTQK